MSTHKVEVIRINEIEKHPNADSLGLVRVGGWTCAVRLGDWQPGDLAAYVEPDYVVPDVEAFAFLKGARRIKAKRLRGMWSQGLLTRAPEGASEGDDVMEALGVTRYEPEMRFQKVGAVRDDVEPPHHSLASLAKYDLEPWQRHRDLLIPGEIVAVTEKIHGANARYAWRDGRLWVGSRTQWKKRVEDAFDPWWAAVDQHPQIEDWCKRHPEFVLFGEVFGDRVQDLKYGTKSGEVRFAAFDIFDAARGEFVDFSWLASMTLYPSIETVPFFGVGAYDPTSIEALASGRSMVPGANHLREGIVIRPLVERWDPRVGRVVLKLVSNEYLERAS
jgi:RNA ligase (TIGR02306 family)